MNTIKVNKIKRKLIIDQNQKEKQMKKKKTVDFLVIQKKKQY